MAKHTVIWIDHKEARIFRLNSDATTESTVHAPYFVHKHPGGSDRVKEHPDDTRRFFQALANSLTDAEGIVIVGPSSAKLEFLRYVHMHAHGLEPKIVGIETMDHPTDGQIVAYAKQYFNLGGRLPAP
jgi:hypothetical protein